MIFKILLQLAIATSFAQTNNSKESSATNTEAIKKSSEHVANLKKCFSESNLERKDTVSIDVDESDETINIEEKKPVKKTKKVPLADLSNCELLQANGKKIRCTEDEKKSFDDSINNMKKKKSCKKMASEVDENVFDQIPEGHSNKKYKKIVKLIKKKVLEDSVNSSVSAPNKVSQ